MAEPSERYVEVEYSGPSGIVMKQRIGLGEKGNHRIEEAGPVTWLVVWVESMTYKFPMERVLALTMRL